jgi:hypothetical protein
MSASPETVRIFIGTEPRMWRGEAVLRHSIGKHVSGPVEIASMDATNGDAYWKGWEMGRPPGQPATSETTSMSEAVWYTDFTNFRWAIPEACGFQGRAIYVDVDEIFLRDPRELGALEIPPGRGILTLQPYETSVMLFDCAYFRNLDWWPSADLMRTNGWNIRRYVELLHSHGAFAPLPPHWNCLDGNGFTAGTTSLIHYTDMSTQIWRPYPERLAYRRHPAPVAEELWMNLYREAIAQPGFPAAPPPGGQCPEGVEDAFPAFAGRYESEKRWLAMIDAGSTTPTIETCQYSGTNPSTRFRECLASYRAQHIAAAGPNAAGAGAGIAPYVENVKHLIDQSGARSLLDYGAINGGSCRSVAGVRLSSGSVVTDVPRYWGVQPDCFDPGETDSGTSGKRYDGVISVDYLAHCPEADLPWTLDDIFGYASKFVFAVITATGGPEGVQPAMTIRSSAWWSRVIDAVATRHAGIRYFFIVDMRYELADSPGRYGTKIDLIEGPRLRVRQLQ